MRKKSIVRTGASAEALLGRPVSKAIVKPVSMGNECVICGKRIPGERLDALKMLGTPRTQWTHVGCSQTGKIKGIYMGEVGTSKLQLCDKIYNDSVRSVFKKSEFEDSDEAEE